MKIKPITLKEANRFVAQYHRHHGETVGHKFSIGLFDGNALVGVAICGRPVSRILDDGLTCEVNRLCTNGAHNACSMLYGASARVAKEMGYDRIITYILESESGTSLKASGWICEGKSGGRIGRDAAIPGLIFLASIRSGGSKNYEQWHHAGHIKFTGIFGRNCF